MNKKIFFGLLGFLSVVGLLYCIYAWTLVGSRPSRMWLHRCNSIAKLQDKKDSYRNIEVDVCLRPDGTLDVTRDMDTSYCLSVKHYFKFISQHRDRRICMDVRNLADDNCALFYHSLDSLMKHYEMRPEQVVIESPRWDLLRSFTLKGFYTSYRMTDPLPSELEAEQMDSVAGRLGRVIRSGCVCAVSMPEAWYMPLRGLYQDTAIEYMVRARGGQFRLMLTPVGRRMLDDRRVRAILVQDEGMFHR